MTGSGCRVAHCRIISQNTYRGEADYYIKTGTVVMARSTVRAATIAPNPTMHTQAWGIGGEHALTSMGNVVLRAAFTQEHDGDPVALAGTTDKLFRTGYPVHVVRRD